MGQQRCAACDRQFSVATGRENVWVLRGQSAGGMILELSDGTSYPLCAACLERLPPEPTKEDIAALTDRSLD